MSKQTQQDKKATAKALYLSGMSMEEIAGKVGVTRPTVSRWCSDDGWKEARAAKNITRPELVNKLLLAIDNLIEQVNEKKDPALLAYLGDKLSKLSSVIQKLDKKDLGRRYHRSLHRLQQMAGVPRPDRQVDHSGTAQGHQPLPGHLHRGAIQQVNYGNTERNQRGPRPVVRAL